MNLDDTSTKSTLIEEMNTHMVPFTDSKSNFEDDESVVEFSMFESTPFGQNKVMIQVYFDKDENRKYDCVVR